MDIYILQKEEIKAFIEYLSRISILSDIFKQRANHSSQGGSTRTKAHFLSASEWAPRACERCRQRKRYQSCQNAMTCQLSKL